MEDRACRSGCRSRAHGRQHRPPAHARRAIAASSTTATPSRPPLAGEGAQAADSLTRWSRRCGATRRLDDAAGRRGDRGRGVANLAACSRPATPSSTAATRSGRTTSAARVSWQAKGLHYVDVGTSGGVWGLERGYCLMIGGEAGRRRAPRSDLRRAGAGRGDNPATATREGRDPRASGLSACGPNGAGHFVKMIHNGIEYGMMQAMAEGFDILKQRQLAQAAARTAPRHRRRRHRRGLAPRQRRHVMAARSDRGRAGGGPAARRLFRPRRGFGRGPLDGAGGHRGGGAGRGADRARSIRASARARITRSPRRCCRPCARASAATSSRKGG